LTEVAVGVADPSVPPDSLLATRPKVLKLLLSTLSICPATPSTGILVAALNVPSAPILKSGRYHGMALVGAVEMLVGGPRYAEPNEFDLDTEMEVAVRTMGLLRVEPLSTARPFPFRSIFGPALGIGTVGRTRKGGK
jgi:hypothetical protein